MNKQPGQKSAGRSILLRGSAWHFQWLRLFRFLVFLQLSMISLGTGRCARASAQVRVWQGTFSLPVYEEGPPDTNPPFDQLATNRFNYPYTLRTNLTDRRVEHPQRAVFLENEYLKCTVLPDLGGHLYTCLDKINGREMFYANPSIKKANIGYRGAWAAFGMEYNFPVSHNWMSLSPVDFAFAKHEDGSASVMVGNVDRVYGMQWSVEMVLRPKSSVLEQRVVLSNRSDTRHRFYWWNNAGIEVWDDSRVQYPMRFAASHGFTEVQPWPVDELGHDLSVIRNQTDGPVSLFVHGSREPFMGVWNPHTDSGTVHFRQLRRTASEKDLVLGRRFRRPRLAQSSFRQRQRICRSTRRTVSQSGDVCVPRTATSNQVF